MSAGAARVRAAIGVMVLLATLCGCGGDSTAGVTSPGTPTTAVAAIALSESAAAVDQLGRERFPTAYAGVDVGTERVVVYRVPSAEFDRAVQDLGGAVDLRDAPYSAAALQEVADRIAGDVDYWQGIGVTISSVGAVFDGTSVEVGTPRPDEAAPLLARRYGEQPPITVVAAGPVVPATG